MNEDQCKYFIIACTHTLLINLKARSLPAIKPCRGTNLTGHSVVGMTRMKNIKCKTVSIKVIARKPAGWDA